MQISGKTFASLVKLSLGSLLVALVLLLNALAASPQLHELFHPDAGETHHQCVVTMFAHGKVETVTYAAPAAIAVTWVEIVPRLEFSVFHPAMVFLPDGRGPPALPAVS